MNIMVTNSATRRREGVRLFLPIVATLVVVTSGWVQPHRQHAMLSCRALPANFQEQGNEKIYEAAAFAGVKPDDLDIVWKPGKITVQVNSQAYMSDPLEDGEDGEEELNWSEETFSGTDVTILARAINAAFDDQDIGERIAETHEIEVTTPGASDLLEGVMFESYKGFDVIVEFEDKKKGKLVKLEGRLVEKNGETLVVNLKGRMKKIKNEDLISVRLPKAKKE